MLIVAVAVLFGALALHSLPMLPSTPLLIVMLFASVLAFWARPRCRALAAFGLGFVCAGWQASQRLDADLPPAWAGHDLIIQGYIADLPEHDTRRARFRFQAQRVQQADTWIAFDHRLRLNWYRAPPLTPGHSYQLRVRLKPRMGFRNPGGFDYAGWLLQQDINATGYVRDGQALPSTAAVFAPLLSMRTAIDGALHRALAGHPQHGVLRALLLGARDGIDPEQWAIFRATGTGHLIAISGLHIGLMAGLGVLLGRALWRCSAPLCQRLAAPRAGALIGLLLASLYALLAGLSVPTRRAWIMAALCLLAIWSNRAYAPWQGLAWALLLVVLVDPLALLSPGFWLSFVAVAVIFSGLAAPRPSQRAAILWQLPRIQWRLSLGLLPFGLLFFGQLGWVAPFANLWAVPWTSWVVVPLLFAGLLCLLPAPELAQWWFRAAAWAAERLQNSLAWCAALPMTNLSRPKAPLGLMLAALLGVALLLLPRGLPRRGFAWLLIVPLLLWRPPRPPAGELWFTLLDVGQGLAAVLRTRHHVLVYDAGARFSANFDAGSAVVAPYLRRLGITQIDRLLISHGDNDHRGGAAELDRLIPAYSLWTSVPGRIDWRYANHCRAGQQWRWDGVLFRVLHPAAAAQGNDASCVLQVETANGQRLLLPGDLEAAGEARLLTHSAHSLNSALLVAPHHGSASSSSSEFIAAVAPAAVLFPVGYGNRYGFPDPAVVDRYLAQGTQVYSTAASGALEVRLGHTDAIRVRAAVQRRHYWDPDRSAAALPQAPPR